MNALNKLLKITIVTITSLWFPVVIFAQIPLSQNSLQLQQLIVKSEQQIVALKKILEQNKNDEKTLKETQRILNKLTAGIDESIKEYQGTKAYEAALLELQSKNNYISTYSDIEKVRNHTSINTKDAENEFANNKFQNIKIFQAESVRANQEDLEQQKKLQVALLGAGPGFISKIQAQSQIGNWQTNTRLSTQVTELISSIHAMREEMRALRLKEEKAGNTIDMLIKGSEMQNQTMRQQR